MALHWQSNSCAVSSFVNRRKTEVSVSMEPTLLENCSSNQWRAWTNYSSRKQVTISKRVTSPSYDQNLNIHQISSSCNIIVNFLHHPIDELKMSTYIVPLARIECTSILSNLSHHNNQLLEHINFEFCTYLSRILYGYKLMMSVNNKCQLTYLPHTRVFIAKCQTVILHPIFEKGDNLFVFFKFT